MNMLRIPSLRNAWCSIGVLSFAMAASHTYAAETVVIPLSQRSALSLVASWKEDCKGIDLWNAKTLPRKVSPAVSVLSGYFQSAKDGKLRAHLDLLAPDGTRQATANTISNEAALRSAFRNLQGAVCAGSLAADTTLTFHLIQHKVQIPLAEKQVDRVIGLPIATRCENSQCKVSSQFRQADLVAHLMALASRASEKATYGASGKDVSGKKVPLTWRPYEGSEALVSGTWHLAESSGIPQFVQNEMRRIEDTFRNARTDVGAERFRQSLSSAYVSLRGGIGKPPVKVGLDGLLTFAKGLRRFDIIGMSPTRDDFGQGLVFVSTTSESGIESIEALPFSCANQSCTLVSAGGQPVYSIPDLFTFGAM